VDGCQCGDQLGYTILGAHPGIERGIIVRSDTEVEIYRFGSWVDLISEATGIAEVYVANPGW